MLILYKKSRLLFYVQITQTKKGVISVIVELFALTSNDYHNFQHKHTHTII